MRVLKSHEVKAMYGRMNKRCPELGCFSHYELIGNELYRVRKDGTLEGYPVDVLESITH
jgi:hypothetical protein